MVYHSSNDVSFPGFLIVVYVIVWLVGLGRALLRKDLDPVTLLMWVLVIILVPLFGLLLYWVIGPEIKLNAVRSASGTVSMKEQNTLTRDTDVPSDCVRCNTVIAAGSTICPKCGWTYLHESNF